MTTNGSFFTFHTIYSPTSASPKTLIPAENEVALWHRIQGGAEFRGQTMCNGKGLNLGHVEKNSISHSPSLSKRVQNSTDYINIPLTNERATADTLQPPSQHLGVPPSSPNQISQV